MTEKQKQVIKRVFDILEQNKTTRMIGVHHSNIYGDFIFNDYYALFDDSNFDNQYEDAEHQYDITRNINTEEDRIKINITFESVKSHCDYVKKIKRNKRETVVDMFTKYPYKIYNDDCTEILTAVNAKYLYDIMLYLGINKKSSGQNIDMYIKDTKSAIYINNMDALIMPIRLSSYDV